MVPSTTLSVIVPVYNEEHLVAASLARLRVLGESPLLRRIKVIVVDDGSTDRTPASLEHFKASLDGACWGSKFEWRFLRHDRKRGKGSAIRTALEHAGTDLTVFHDADLEYHPRDLLRMIPLFLEEDAEAAFGSRFLPGQFKRALFFRHALGNHLLTFLCDLVCDLNLTDVETCYKMVRTELLRSIPLESSDFRIEVELTIKLAKRGARMFEVPISYSGRTYEEGKKINWRDGLRAFLAAVKYAASDRIYLKDSHGAEILARLGRAPRFNRWLADTVKPYLGNRVLEVGAGIGNLTVHLAPRSVYWATDVDPLYVDRLRGLRRNRPYLSVGTADVTKPESFPDGQEFDTVVCMNVIEHIEDDLGAMRNLWGAIGEGGRAILLVPQGPGLYGSLDRVLAHFRRYTKEQLIALADRAGFRICEVLEFNRVGALAWWINGKLLRRTTFGRLQIKILNLLAPVFRKLDRWLPLPALSLIAVLEKTGTTSSGGGPAIRKRSSTSDERQS